MNLDTLNIFITLAEELHFRKTSDQHHITISTVTRLIQRLEKELNTTLFKRNNRKVALTKEGKKVYNYAKKTRTAYQELLNNLHPHDSKQLQGQIKLYSTVTAAYHILPPIIKSFRQNYPAIMTYLETGEVKQGDDKLLAEDIDFSIGIINKKKLTQFLSKKVLETPLIFIEPIQKQTQTTLSMIFPEQGDLATIIKKYLTHHKQPYTVHSYVKGHEAILSMVSAGLGSAILPKIVVENSHLSQLIKENKTYTHLPTLEVGLFAKKTALSPVQQAFWNEINKK